MIVVPALLFVAWYAGWGHEAESHLGLRNLLSSPRFVFDALASTVGSLAGLGVNPYPYEVTPDPNWGRPLLVALVIGLGFLQWRRPGVSRGFWTLAVATLAYWGLAAINFIPGREPTGSRYQYAGAVLLMML